MLLELALWLNCQEVPEREEMSIPARHQEKALLALSFLSHIFRYNLPNIATCKQSTHKNLNTVLVVNTSQ